MTELSGFCAFQCLHSWCSSSGGNSSNRHRHLLTFYDIFIFDSDIAIPVRSGLLVKHSQRMPCEKNNNHLLSFFDMCARLATGIINNAFETGYATGRLGKYLQIHLTGIMHLKLHRIH